MILGYLASLIWLSLLAGFELLQLQMLTQNQSTSEYNCLCMQTQPLA